jgi:hypothetical protein
MWSSVAWTTVIFAYVAVLALGVACECFRAMRARALKRTESKEPPKYNDVIGFR